jgi:hypothetical protein
MKGKAAVAHKAGAPLEIETVDLDGPGKGPLLKQKGHAKPLRPNGLSCAVLEMCYSERRRLTRGG